MLGRSAAAARSRQSTLWTNLVSARRSATSCRRCSQTSRMSSSDILLVGAATIRETRRCRSFASRVPATASETRCNEPSTNECTASLLARELALRRPRREATARRGSCSNQ